MIAPLRQQMQFLPARGVGTNPWAGQSMTGITRNFRYQIGDVSRHRGDVTQLSAILNKTARQIERALGYQPFRLREGWSLMMLIDAVHQGDFLWGDTTEFSGGFAPDQEIDEMVHRMDEVRGALLVKYGNDAAADRTLRPFLAEQRQLLNVRVGGHRICKVMPNVPHISSRDWWIQYPNSSVAGIRQWTLRVRKRMRCVASIAPDELLTVAPVA